MGKHEDDGSSNPPPPSKRRKSDEKRAAAATAAAASASVGEASHPHEEHRAGQLYKLHLENFMCHENFSMTFGCGFLPSLRFCSAETLRTVLSASRGGSRYRFSLLPLLQRAPSRRSPLRSLVDITT